MSDNKLKKIQCPFCNNIELLDINNIPTGISFDYQCKKCKSFHKIRL